MVYRGGFNSGVALVPVNYDVPLFSKSSLNIKKRRKKKLYPLEPSKFAIDNGKHYGEMEKFIFPFFGREIKSLQGSSRKCFESDKCNIVPVRVIPEGKTCKQNILSSRSKKKIKDKASAFFAVNQKTTFVTLGFIGKVSDKKAVLILNKFLTTVRKEMDLKYIWVAERQTKNVAYFNNIHFHIINNCYWDIKRYNSLWVRVQLNEGIKNNIYSDKEISELLHNGEIENGLNPFDVKFIKNQNSVAAYVTKYVTKNNAGFWCSAWHCSREVSKLFCSTIITQEQYSQLDNLDKNFSVNTKTGEIYYPQTYADENSRYEVKTVQNKHWWIKNSLRELITVNKIIWAGIYPSSVPVIDILDYSLKYIKNKTTSFKKLLELGMLTAKNYMQKFKVCYKTALKMIKEDKQRLGVTVILEEHFKQLYKVEFAIKK